MKLKDINKTHLRLSFLYLHTLFLMFFVFLLHIVFNIVALSY